MTNIGKLVGKVPLKTIHKPHQDIVSPDTLIGVEIEAENATLPKGFVWEGMQYWNPHPDDSLRDNGCEYAFVTPLFGADAVAALKGLCKLANERGFKISGRTGLHVHVDVRDLTLDQFRTFCVLYSMVEKMLYRWVGDNRESNIFCLPWYHAEGDLSQLSSAFAGDNETHAKFNNLHRYAGLNLQAVAKFGSAEFRHLKTTFDYERIRTWINILLSLRDAAVAWQGSPEGLMAEYKLLGCMRFTHKIFPLTVLKELWYTEAPKDVVESGLLTASYILNHTDKAKASKKIDFNSIYTRYKTLRGKHEGVLAWEKAQKERAEKYPELKQDKLAQYKALMAHGSGYVPEFFARYVLVVGSPIGNIKLSAPSIAGKLIAYTHDGWAVDYAHLVSSPVAAAECPFYLEQAKKYVSRANKPPPPAGMFSASNATLAPSWFETDLSTVIVSSSGSTSSG